MVWADASAGSAATACRAASWNKTQERFGSSRDATHLCLSCFHLGSTAHRPRFAIREWRWSPTQMARSVARHASWCPDPSRIGGDSTRVPHIELVGQDSGTPGGIAVNRAGDSTIPYRARGSVRRSIVSRRPSVTYRGRGGRSRAHWTLCSLATAAPTRDRQHRAPPLADGKPQTGKKIKRP